MNTSSKPTGSRRKRRGTGRVAPSEYIVQPIPTHQPPTGSKYGRYERSDFEQLEQMLASFVARRLGQVVPPVKKGFFNAASAAERKNPELQTAFYSYLMYGWKDERSIRVVDLFNHAGIELTGRLQAALDACLYARLVLLSVDDLHVRKHRIRGRDLLRGEELTVRDRNAVEALSPGDCILSWMIPWGTSWQPIGVANLIQARKRDALNQALDSLAKSFKCNTQMLPGRHPAHLFWVVYRVANMNI